VTVVLLKIAIGLSKLSVTTPAEVAEAALTAEIVTLVVVGIDAGAVYSPVVEIVPVALEPPATPFTCQTTAVFVVPVTVALNCVVPLRRTEEAPVTATVMEVVLLLGFVEVPEQPARNKKARSAVAKDILGIPRRRCKRSISRPPHFAARRNTRPSCRKAC
jgi:hypothetical protein